MNVVMESSGCVTLAAGDQDREDLFPDERGVPEEALRFERAIRGWARDYAIRYREAPAPKPSLEDARVDLGKWLKIYCRP